MSRVPLNIGSDDEQSEYSNSAGSTTSLSYSTLDSESLKWIQKRRSRASTKKLVMSNSLAKYMTEIFNDLDVEGNGYVQLAVLKEAISFINKSAIGKDIIINPQDNHKLSHDLKKDLQKLDFNDFCLLLNHDKNNCFGSSSDSFLVKLVEKFLQYSNSIRRKNIIDLLGTGKPLADDSSNDLYYFKSLFGVHYFVDDHTERTIDNKSEIPYSSGSSAVNNFYKPLTKSSSIGGSSLHTSFEESTMNGKKNKLFESSYSNSNSSSNSSSSYGHHPLRNQQPPPPYHKTTGTSKKRFVTPLQPLFERPPTKSQFIDTQINNNSNNSHSHSIVQKLRAEQLEKSKSHEASLFPVISGLRPISRQRHNGNNFNIDVEEENLRRTKSLQDLVPGNGNDSDQKYIFRPLPSIHNDSSTAIAPSSFIKSKNGVTKSSSISSTTKQHIRKNDRNTMNASLQNSNNMNQLKLKENRILPSINSQIKKTK